MHIRRIAVQTFALLVFLAFAAQALAQGNRQLMSQKMAEQDMKRQLVEAVVGFKVKSEGEFGLTEDAQYKVDTKAAAVIKGIKVDKMVYDKEKDIALCYGHIELGRIKNITGLTFQFKNVKVQSFGFGSMTEASRVPLRALRAALINAYDEMAAKLIGEKILSQSSAENFILTKDSNRSKVCAALFGAYIPNPEMNAANRGWGWDENGLAFVRLNLDARVAKDIMGNIIVYTGGENILEVTGYGAQKDELSPQGPEGGPSMIRPGGPKTSYQNLDVPIGGGQAKPQQELKGMPAQ
ncbi:hypothetical protein NNJEOMEG_01526 [Fundidesulfovibrio magnetotacticus]|uniref:Uncharacterized protein n=1 Tax=Fundidesulfovibrio magnetotacticus TaxID=2730080 RepID=A0A6V8LLY9_9BACT|nr:hypothetical protein [Fundidesulfovibrio magnetotacticus]GFK93692.1 hypothetical protein NNJEOMEG_01526 [Fundidesulfovibrio magnetotacticus]